MIRQQIRWVDITPFYQQHLPIILDEANTTGVKPGVPTGLIYEWNEKTQQTDIAAAIPVPEGTKIRNPIIGIVDLSASKAVFVDHYGPYDKLRDAYAGLENYLTANKLTRKFPIIEQYITDPGIEKDTSKWLTKIIFLIK
jgi:effector-binding domain-containing protein